MLSTITHDIRDRIQEYGEAEGQQLTPFVFLDFALILIQKALPHWNIQAWIFAILSLTILIPIRSAVRCNVSGCNLRSSCSLRILFFQA